MATRPEIPAAGYRYALCTLETKRAEIAGSLASLRLQEARYEQDLAKIDEVLRILDPASDPSQIVPKKPIRYLNVFKQGELGRLIIAILRAENRPMGNLEIASIIFVRGGFGPELWTPIRRRTQSNLAYLATLGRVEKTGRGLNAKWDMAESHCGHSDQLRHIF
jgi:hypothetical protein